MGRRHSRRHLQAGVQTRLRGRSKVTIHHDVIESARGFETVKTKGFAVVVGEAVPVAERAKALCRVDLLGGAATFGDICT